MGEIFNKGIDSSEKQEGLLKRLKNIEGKNEQQLDLTRDQGDRQLDLIGRTNTNRTKSIGSQNERLNRLEFEIREKEEKIKELKKDKKQTPFVYTTTDYTTYDFSRYTHLLNFAEDVYKKFLLFDEAKDEQKHMPKEIKELEKRINPKTGSGPKEKNMKKMQYVVKKMERIFMKLEML